MILIDDKLISEEIISKQFVCDLNACKGICCVEGDAGAPVEAAEVELMEQSLEQVLPYMTEKGRQVIEEVGVVVKEDDDEYTGYATPLIENAACAFIAYKKDGTAACAFELAYMDGKSKFRKPISCHLYPVRVKNYNTVVAVNYDEWDICSAACTLGESLRVPIYVFVKDALVRKFGEEFYEVLALAAKEREEGKSTQ